MNAATPRSRSGELKRVTRFLAVGVLNTAFGYSVFAVLVLAGISPQRSLLGATVVGVVFNFFSFGRLVFSHRGGFAAALRFLVAYAASYGLNAWLLDMLLGRLGMSALPAQLVCIPPVVALNYVLMRKFVFRQHPTAVQPLPPCKS